MARNDNGEAAVEPRRAAPERVSAPERITAPLTPADSQEHVSSSITARNAATDRMVNDGTLPKLTLSAEAIGVESNAVHKALNAGIFGNSPDVAALSRILGPMSSADRKNLESDYRQHFGRELRADMKEKLSPTDYLAQVATLDRVDGRSNIKGMVNLSLEMTKTDPEAGQRLLRSTLETLNGPSLAQLDKQFKGPDGNGKGFVQTILDNPDVSQANKDMVRAMVLGAQPREAGPGEAAVELDGKRFAVVGADARKPADVVAMANIALKAGDLRMFAEAVGDESPSARAALKQLQADPKFTAAYQDTFEKGKSAAERQVAEDIRTEGRVSLATIIQGNSNVWLGLLDNPGNTDFALSNATTRERNDYRIGKELAERAARDGTTADKLATTPELKAAVDYHQKVEAAMDKTLTMFDGTVDQLRKSVLEDQLLHGGKTLISELAATHSSGSHTTDAIMSAAERMSKADYDRLHGNPQELAKYQADLARSLDAYATPEEKARILAMVTDKANAPSYDAANGIKRSVTDVMNDTRATHWFGRSDTFDNTAVTARIATMSAEDAQKYRNNTDGFRAKVDKFVSEQLPESSAQRYLAETTLKQVAETGKPPQLNPVQQVIKDNLDGADPATRVRDMERVLQDKNLVEQLKQVEAARALGAAEMSKRMEDPAFAAAFRVSNALRESAPYLANQNSWNQALQDGQIGAGVKYSLGVPMSSLYEDFARAPQQVRDRVSLSGDQRQILDSVIKQDGKATLADQLRSFAIGDGGDFRDFRDRLAALTPAQRESLKNEYSAKYNSSLDNDFLGKVDKAHSIEYGKLLSTTSGDGVQDFVDRRLSADKSGTAADASALTLDRTVQSNQSLLTEYSRMRQNLPEDRQRVLDQLFSEAKFQQVQSEHAKAELIYNATMAAAMLASIPATAGLSTAALAALVPAATAAGAAYRVELMKAVEGGNFDDSTRNMVRQSLLGAADGLLIAAPAALFGKGVKGAAELAPSTRTEIEVFVTQLRATGTTGREVVVAGTGREAVYGGVLREVQPALTGGSRELLPAATKGREIVPAAAATTGRELIPAATATAGRELVPAATATAGRELVVAGTSTTGRELVAAGTREVVPAAEGAGREVGAALGRAEARRGPTIIDGEYTVISETTAARASRLRPALGDLGLAPETAVRIAAAAQHTDAALAARKPADAPVVEPVVPPAVKEYKPSEAMIKAATVRRGEGPWQSAERILKADGKQHSLEEVRALTKAIQQVYALNPNNPSMSSLKVQHNFVADTAKSYTALINAVKDDRVKALLIKFAAQ
ncbi:MAG: hypothetical protein U0103_17635 [Candidatus Obscuribacterales bacterium]